MAHAGDEPGRAGGLLVPPGEAAEGPLAHAVPTPLRLQTDRPPLQRTSPLLPRRLSRGHLPPLKISRAQLSQVTQLFHNTGQILHFDEGHFNLRHMVRELSLSLSFHLFITRALFAHVNRVTDRSAPAVARRPHGLPSLLPVSAASPV
jgi:hypothetical protein